MMWQAVQQLGQYKRYDGVPCTGHAIVDAFGFKVFDEKFIKLLFQMKGPWVSIGVGPGSVFVEDAKTFVEMFLDDPKGQKANKGGAVHEQIRRALDPSGDCPVGNIVEMMREGPDQAKVHKKLRKAIAVFGTPERQQEFYQDIMEGQLQKVAVEWRRVFDGAQSQGADAIVDASLGMTKYTLGAVSEAWFGIEDVDELLVHLNEKVEAVADNSELNSKVTKIEGFAELKWAIRKSNDRISEWKGSAGVYVDPKLESEFAHGLRVINTYAAYVDQYGPQQYLNGRNTGKPTLLGVLHEMYPGDENSETRRANVIAGMIAGFETTSITLLYSLYALQNSEQDRELYRAVKNGDTQYIEDFIDETVRMFPGIPMLNRRVGRETDVETEVRGEKQKYQLNEGDLVSISVKLSNRDPKQWPEGGPDLEKFNPKRWAYYRSLSEEERKKSGFLTFGARQTGCLGPKFVKKEMTVFYEWLYTQKFMVETTDGKEPRVNGSWIIQEFTDPAVSVKLVERDKSRYVDIDMEYELNGPRVKPELLPARGDSSIEEEHVHSEGSKCPFHKLVGKKN